MRLTINFSFSCSNQQITSVFYVFINLWTHIPIISDLGELSRKNHIKLLRSNGKKKNIEKV